MPWRIILPALLVAAAIALVLWLALRPRQRQILGGSYGDIRREIIRQSAGNHAPRTAPARPVNLDKRLPASTARDLRRLDASSTDADRLYQTVVDTIRDELAAIDRDQDWFELISPARRTIILFENLNAEVNNGGFDQFFLNSSGDGAAATPAALRQLGLPQILALVEKANAQFPGGPPTDRSQRLQRMDSLPQSARDVWSALDDQFFKLEGNFAATACIPFILAHEAEFFKQ